MIRFNSKFFLFLTVCLLSLSLVFAGCEAEEPEEVVDEEPEEVVDEEPEEVEYGEVYEMDIFLAGATPGGGGVWDMLGAGLAEAIMRGNEGTVTVMEGGGVIDVPMVSQCDAELGLTHSTIELDGLNAEGPFEDEEPFDNIRSIAALYESSLQFFVHPDLGVDSYKDIVENEVPVRIAVGDPGSTTELINKRILEYYGATYEDIEEWGGAVVFEFMGTAVDLYLDGQIDAFNLLTSAPNAPTQRMLASTDDVKIIGLEEELRQALEEAHGYDLATISKDIYPEVMDEDIQTLSSWVTLMTKTERPNEEIYHVTRALVENMDYIHGLMARLEDMDEETMATYVGAPLHDGAEEYYREIGVLE